MERQKKGKIGLHSTQPLAKRGKTAQICSEIRNLNKKVDLVAENGG